MSTTEKMDKLANAGNEITNQIIALWFNEVLFTWRWWVGVMITIFTWLFWIKYHKKESKYRLLTAGFFVMTVSVSLDAIGVQIGLWTYRYEVIPLAPAYIPYDLALMPVVIMFLIQYKPQYSPFKKSIIFGILTALIGEPLIVFLDIYKPENWRSLYSIPIYTVIFLIAHWLTTRKKFDTLL
jgi:hypothetical protein